jgi:hypothetical protein
MSATENIRKYHGFDGDPNKPLDEPPESQWRPMETAPKDGSPILVRRMGLTTPWVVFWVYRQEPADGRWFLSNSSTGICDDEPTAWMPIPQQSLPPTNHQPLIAEIEGAISLAKSNWMAPYAVMRFTKLLRECVTVLAPQPHEPAATQIVIDTLLAQYEDPAGAPVYIDHNADGVGANGTMTRPYNNIRQTIEAVERRATEPGEG